MSNTETQMNEEEIEINLSELFQLIKTNIKMIVIVALICTLIAGLGTVFLIDKKYQSTARIYPKPEVTEGIVDYTQINANNLMVNNYIAMINGNNIQSMVAQQLDMAVEDISNSLSVSNETNTQIISITATTTDPETSKEIVDCVVDTFKQEAKDTLNINNITTVDQAEIETDPVSPNLKVNLLIGAFIGAFFSIGYLFIKFMLDTHIHNNEEAEKYLGIPNLGAIPWFED